MRDVVAHFFFSRWYGRCTLCWVLGELRALG